MNEEYFFLLSAIGLGIFALKTKGEEDGTL
jgi:hypothetical protein